MKMVMSILRSTCLNRLMKELERIEVRDVTINTVEGLGEEVTVFKDYAVHKMIRIIVAEDKAEEIVKVILSAAHTGFAGDGIIAVYPVDYMIKIRTMERFV
jgi:nitrogen regulatory protein P-II 1